MADLVVYRNNLQGEKISTAMAGLVNYTSGTFTINASHELAETSPADGHQCLLKSIPQLADFDFRYVFNPADGNGQLGLIFRSDSTDANGYVIVWDDSLVYLFKKVTGSYTLIGSGITRSSSYTGSDNVYCRVYASGSDIKCKIWKTSDTEPGSWTYTWTDSTYTSAGYFGVYQSTTLDRFLPASLVSIDFVKDITTALDSIESTSSPAYFSPYNWRTIGDNRMQSANPGAYFKVNFTGTSFVAYFDVGELIVQGVSASNWPQLAVQVDNGTWSSGILINQSNMTLASGLSSGSHTIRCAIKVDVETTDRWNGPTSAVRLLALAVDNDCSISVPSVNSKKAIFYGDSITEGVYVNAADYTTGNNGVATSAFLLGDRTNTEFGIIGWGATGWLRSGNGNAPGLDSFWDDYDANQSRLVSGALSPVPDYIFINEGTNESATADATIRSAVHTQIDALRTASPSAKIYVIIPFNQTKASAISNGITDAADSNTFKLDLGSDGVTYSTTNPTYSYDGLHPNASGHLKLANLLYGLIDIAPPRLGFMMLQDPGIL